MFFILLVFIGNIFFGIAFTVIRKFYYGSFPTIQEYLFPVFIGSFIGGTVGLWNLKSKWYKERLEELIAKRTTELRKSNEQLTKENIERKRAERDSERANKLKSEFLANISHELRTPMHGILSYSKFGINKADTISKERNLHYFKQIKKSGERLIGLLNDILDLSKLEAGKESYRMSVINILRVTKDIVLELTPLWKEKSLNVIITNPTEQTDVIGDEHKIGQIIRNLLSNAIKFSQSGKKIIVSFSLNQSRKSPNPGYLETIPFLCVSVKDEGIGIPANELESIFDKFTQSNSTKAGVGGTGLGLAICDEIIKAHSGKIWAENNHGKGATFSFILPYKHEAA